MTEGLWAPSKKDVWIFFVLASVGGLSWVGKVSLLEAYCLGSDSMQPSQGVVLQWKPELAA